VVDQQNKNERYRRGETEIQRRQETETRGEGRQKLSGTENREPEKLRRHEARGENTEKTVKKARGDVRQD
jgi:hypothetical protein